MMFCKTCLILGIQYMLKKYTEGILSMEPFLNWRNYSYLQMELIKMNQSKFLVGLYFILK